MIVPRAEFDNAYRGLWVNDSKNPAQLQRPLTKADCEMVKSKVAKKGEDGKELKDDKGQVIMEDVMVEVVKKTVSTTDLKQVAAGTFGGGYDTLTMMADLDRGNLNVVVHMGTHCEAYAR